MLVICRHTADVITPMEAGAFHAPLHMDYFRWLFRAFF